MCNGWSNWETFTVYNYLVNTESVYQSWDSRALELLEGWGGDKDDAAADQLAEELEGGIAGNAPDNLTPVMDSLLQGALEDVDWLEVAIAFIESAFDEYTAGLEEV